MGIADKGFQESPDNEVRVELNFSVDEIRQLIKQLPTQHRLVAELKRQLERSVFVSRSGCGQPSSTGRKLTYLADKLNVSNMETLFSKALSLMNIGVQLEEKGYEICAVKRNLFTKEVIKIRLQRG